MFNLLKIKALMSEKKITQKQLADDIGITRQTVANYFNGRSTIDVLTLGKIAELFNVDVNYFYNDKPNQANEPAEPYTKKPKYIEQRLDEVERRLNNLEKKT